MTKEIESIGSRYAIIAVIASVGLIQFVLFLISLAKNTAAANTLVDLFLNYPLPASAGILSLLISAHFFGKKAGLKLEKDIRLGSSIGFTTAIQVLAVVALTLSLAVVIQISWNEGFNLLFSMYFLLRVAVPILLLGLPLALLMGYSFGVVLKNKLKNNKT
ncbi:hypothetical protein DXT99_26100 [Pontibacter diazotrophicus]|uniref:Uncharacterized protein n=1 Tax=Pontibacter diazotrophicus TaxID=1400979 RepID=A0A3D8KZT7_9BACT|nr:hypothetical protein [Pontibacter diazotrophicus]RDV10709.1 hypothetical protein DXT99_26100 [Pontibacter diazotrophicus]